MYNQSAEIYDALYIDGIGKDYEKDAETIKAIIRSLNPEAKTILDVACGTGEHARYLHTEFEIDGIDKEKRFVEIASKKLPQCNFTEADMKSFSLGKRYDVVQCLFSAIAYLTSFEELTAALRCFREHLRDGGIIVIEPFIERDVWKASSSGTTVVETADKKITRDHLTVEIGLTTCLQFEFTVEHLEQGERGESRVERFREEHHVALFNRDEILDCFAAAGLAAAYDEEGLSGRGLYVARAVESGQN